jgi:hypothetical protein
VSVGGWEKVAQNKSNLLTLQTTVNIIPIFAKVWSRMSTKFFMPVVTEAINFNTKAILRIMISSVDRRAAMFWG